MMLVRDEDSFPAFGGGRTREEDSGVISDALSHWVRRTTQEGVNKVVLGHSINLKPNSNLNAVLESHCIPRDAQVGAVLLDLATGRAGSVGVAELYPESELACDACVDLS